MRRAVTLALILALGALPALSKEEEKEPDPEAVRGKKEALEDIEKGEAKILTFGLPILSMGLLDPETGLPKSNMGCVVGGPRSRYAAAYNDEVRKALKDGRLDGKTLKHKVTTREALEKRFEDGNPIDLVLSGPEVPAPGAKYSVSLRPKQVRKDDDPTPYLYVKDLETGKSRALLFVGGEAAKLLFDHDGTTALVRDDGYSTYLTFHLPTGLFMQGFPDR